LSSNIAVRLALAVGRRDHLLHAEVRANPLLELSSNILLCGWRLQWDDVTTFFTRR
jgi:hypothetical protein